MDTNCSHIYAQRIFMYNKKCQWYFCCTHHDSYTMNFETKHTFKKETGQILKSEKYASGMILKCT